MAASASPRGHCPQCGAESVLYATRCWLCGWSPPVAGDAGTSPAPPPAIAVPARLDQPRPLQFTIGGLLLVTTVIAVFLGALRAAPGLACAMFYLLVLGVVPAAIRTRAIGARRREAQEPWTAGTRSVAFVESMVIAIVATIAGSITFAMAGYAALWVVCVAIPASGGPPGGMGEVAVMILVVSLISGVIAAGIMGAVMVYRVTWPRRRSNVGMDRPKGP